jgi:hypothetical protein
VDRGKHGTRDETHCRHASLRRFNIDPATLVAAQGNEDWIPGVTSPRGPILLRRGDAERGLALLKAASRDLKRVSRCNQFGFIALVDKLSTRPSLAANGLCLTHAIRIVAILSSLMCFANSLSRLSTGKSRKRQGRLRGNTA